VCPCKSGVSDEKLGVSNKIIDLVKKLFEILLFVAGEFGMVDGDSLIICGQTAHHTLLHPKLRRYKKIKSNQK